MFPYIKNQHFEVTFSAVDGTTKDVSITEVANINRAFLLVAVRGEGTSNAQNLDEIYCTAEFVDASTVRLKRQDATNGCVVVLQVVEADENAPTPAFEVTHGEISFGTTDSNLTDTISSIGATTNAMVVVNTRFAGTADDNSLPKVRGSLDDATTVRLRRGATGAAIVARYQVVKWSGDITLRKGSVAMAGAATANDTISAVTIARTAIYMTFDASNNGIAQTAVKAHLASTTQINFERETTTGTCNIEYAVIEFPAEVARQGEDAGWGDANYSIAPTISPNVTPANTIVFHTNECTGTGTAHPRGLSTAYLSGVSTLTLQRSYNGQTHTVSWQMIDTSGWTYSDLAVDVNDAITVDDVLPPSDGDQVDISESVTIQIGEETEPGDVSVGELVDVSEFVALDLYPKLIDVAESVEVSEDVSIVRDGPPTLSIDVSESVTVDEVPNVAKTLAITLDEVAGSPQDSGNILPNANGGQNEHTVVGETNAWEAMDDPVATPDDDTTYIKTPSGGFGTRNDRFSFDFSFLGDDDTVNSVTVHFRSRHGDGSPDSNDKASAIIFTGSLTWGGTAKDLTTLWADFSQVFDDLNTTLPTTGADFKANWKPGVRSSSNNLQDDDVRHTRLYVVVNYSPLTPAEPVVVSESVSLSVVTPPPADAEPEVSDNVEVSESVNVDITSFVSVFDVVEISEFLSFLGQGDVSVFDAIEISEVVTLDLSYEPNIFDAVEVSELVSVALAHQISVGEDVELSEFVQFELSYELSVSDGVVVSEFVAFDVSYEPSVFDAIEIDEGVDVNVTNLVNVSEEVEISEVVTLILQSYIEVEENITIAEAITLLIPELFLSVFDGVEVSEAVSLVVALDVTADETVEVDDAAQLLLLSNISVVEEIEVSEFVQFNMLSSISVVDEIEISENVTLVLASPVSVSDAVEISESVAIEITTEVSASETIEVSEDTNFEISYEINVGEDIDVAEDTNVALAHQISVFEGIEVSELIALLLEALVNVSDDIDVSEQVAGKIADAELTVSESITVSEDVVVERSRTVDVADAIDVSEEVTLQTTLKVNVAESIEVEDAVVDIIRGNTRDVSVVDNITVQDSPRMFTPIAPVDTYIVYGETGGWLSIVVDNTEVARFKSNGDIDVNGVVNENAF